MTTPKAILSQYWGFSSFREPQEQIIEAVLNRQDVVALLPTGAGKSLCFQVPTLLLQGVCLVISPLVALMQDQVNSLVRKKIKAVTIPSGISQDRLISLFDAIRLEDYKFLYLSPERLQSAIVQEKIKQLNIALIAIDEAHCISQWGHDFRASYLKINILRQLKPDVPCIALTASATPKVLKDIVLLLELKKVKVFKKSFSRENLAYQIIDSEDKYHKIKQIFTKIKSPAIVYARTRKQTRELSSFLNDNHFKSSFYHGGLSAVAKQKAFDNWMNEKTPIIVATNAFGMGIDKPNVGIVIHWDLPNSLENYLQEAGRAGRNEKKAFAVLLRNNADLTLFEQMIMQSLPTLGEIKKIHRQLYQHFQIAKGTFTEHGFPFSFLDFCAKYKFVPNKTYNGLKILQNNGVIRLNDNFEKKATVQFLVSSAQILSYSQKHSEKRRFIEVLLRSYGGLFELPIKIDEFYLAKKMGIPSWEVIDHLENMAANHYIQYKKKNSLATLYFLLPREDDHTIHRIAKNVQYYLRQKKQKATDLIQFVSNDGVCRNKQLLQYFGEKNAKKCNICDVCIAKKHHKIQDISADIIGILNQKACSSREICEILNVEDRELLANLKQLLADKKIAVNSHNHYYITDKK